MTESFARIPRSSASGDATRIIKEMILNGRLKAGDKLPSEQVLAASLGVSRATVRESIGALVAMNILRTVHGRGTYVSSLNTEDLLQPLEFALSIAWSALQDLFDARLALEPAIAAIAAERATDEEIAELRRCAEQAHETVDSPDQFLDLDVKLHRLIAEASHNGILLRLLNSLTSMGLGSRAMTVNLPELASKTAHDHEGIVEAIAARDPHAAREKMAKHVTSVAAAAAEVAHPAQTMTAKRPKTVQPAKVARSTSAKSGRRVQGSHGD